MGIVVFPLFHFRFYRRKREWRSAEKTREKAGNNFAVVSLAAPCTRCDEEVMLCVALEYVANPTNRSATIAPCEAIGMYVSNTRASLPVCLVTARA